jgi:hypothetical protein
MHRWLCTLVVGNAGRIALHRYELITFPLIGGDYIRFLYEEGNGVRGEVSWAVSAIRSMEVRPLL